MVTPEAVTETVLVATEDIAIGDPVTPDLVEEQQIDPEAVQGTPLRSATAVSGQPALFPIPAGSQVTGEAIGLGDGTSRSTSPASSSRVRRRSPSRSIASPASTSSSSPATTSTSS